MKKLLFSALLLGSVVTTSSIMVNDSSKIESPYAGWEYYGGDELTIRRLILSKMGNLP